MSNDMLTNKPRITKDEARERRAIRISGIYALVDPTAPDTVRYVGSSTNMHKRLLDHAAGLTPRNADGPKRAWLAGLKKEGRAPVMVVLELVDAPKASAVMHAAERDWIERFRAKAQADMNATLLAGERRFLRAQIEKLTAENAKLRALLMQHATSGATLHKVACCEDPKAATQRNVSL